VIWHIFFKNPKKKILSGLGLVFFNLFAACLEGVSFSCLLLGLSALNRESLAHPLINRIFPNCSNTFLLFLSAAIILQILKSICAYIANLLMIFLTVNLQKETQQCVFERIFNMPFAQASTLKKGELIHLATISPALIPNLFDEYNRLIAGTFMLIASLFLMGKISLPLTCLVIVFFFCTAAIQKYFLSKITQASQQHSNHLTELTKETTQSLDGLRTVHLFQKQTYMLSKLEDILRKISLATQCMKKLNASIPCVNECLGAVLVGITLLIGIFFIEEASYLFTFLTLTYRLATRLQQLVAAKGMIASYSGQVHRLKAFLAHPPYQPAIERKESALQFQESIAFEFVSFTYPHTSTQTIRQMSLEIPKNRIVALIGSSGAGKSTVADLLLRLYEPTEGAIFVDGKRIDETKMDEWRSLFGVVSQDPFLFYDSIEENIRFGKEQAAEEEIWQAAIQAGAEPFIEKLPEKYKTLIGERGYRLSGGEKQRIALARALIRDPKILVLDEATSHLDSESEQFVQETLLALRGQKTLIVIAHRLSTIQLADLIYVIEKGKIIEKGTHDDLIFLGGRYHLFWNLQSKIAKNTMLV
jgi:ATP-binding cassette subfamily B protein/subfamily B ATP-binding cassette protein MsbA